MSPYFYAIFIDKYFMGKVVAMEDKALLNVKEFCTYLGLGQSKARELLNNPRNGFTVRIGNRLYANRSQLNKWLDEQCI